MTVSTIISGGQTGADYGALLAAEEAGVPTDGYVPEGCRTENGSNYELKRRFNLRELSTRSYAERTRKNVDMSDAVVAFYFHDSPGTGKTIGYAQSGEWTKGSTTEHNGHRPVVVLENSNKDKHEAIIEEFVKRHEPEKLMVAGHRESSSPGMRTHVKTVLLNVLPVVA